MTTTFNTKTEAIEYFETALGEYAADFDLDGIFEEATEWSDGKLVLTDEAEEDFYSIAQKHER